MNFPTAAAGAALLAALGLASGDSAPAVAQPASQALPSLRIDRETTTVSGLSSGGYMAVQLHVAYSSVFPRGVAALAAGPYYCAEGQVGHATGRCLSGDEPIPVDRLQALARQWAASGWIDRLATLGRSRVYLYAGSRDTRVVPTLSKELQRWYSAFVPAAQLRFRNDIPAEHAMVTDDFGNACSYRGLPFINDCDFDLAGELLQHLLGPLAARNDGAPTGSFVVFDQAPFGAARWMGAKGWLYLPRDCAGGELCRLHVVLHGCGQNADKLGEDYVRRTGYTRWADTNRIAMLYPQTGGAAVNGCWDWWGYSGADYPLRSGVQMRAIVAMVERLAGAAATCHTAMNGRHAWAGRAFADWFGSTIAKGSGQRLGGWWSTTTLRESPRGHFALGSC